MPLIDKNTGESIVHYDEARSSEQMTEDFRSGNYDLDPGQKRVNVFMPYQSGQREMFNVPIERLPDVLKDGWHVESSRDRAAREWGESEDGQSLSTMLGVTGSSAFNALFMGAPELHQQLTGNPLESAKNEYLKREYGFADLAGAGLGTVANILATGGVGAGVKTVASKAGSIAAKKMAAARLMSMPGKKMTQEAAEKVADGFVKHLSKNIGTSAVLGTLEMTPLAATEAIWGDPSKAGEYLMMGSMIGGGIGGALSLGGTVARGAAKGARKASEVYSDSVVQKTVLKGLAGATGTSVDALKYNLKNPGKIDDALDIQVQTNRANRFKEDEVRKVGAAREVSKDAEEHMGIVEQNMTREMDQVARQADEVVADRLEEDVGVKLKKLLGLQSQQADDILEFENLLVGKHIVLNPLNKEIKRLSRPGNVGDATQANLKKLQDLKEQIQAMPGKAMDGPTSRNLLRNLREGGVFDRDRAAAGGFDKGYSRAVKGLGEKLSAKLKILSPEYGKKMDEMSPLAEAAKRMVKTFKTRTGRLDIARILATPTKILKRKPADFKKHEDINFVLEALEYNAQPGILKQYEDMLADKIKAIQYMDDHKTMFMSRSKNQKAAFRDKYTKGQAYEAQKAKDDLVQAELNYKTMQPAIGSEGSEYMNVQKLRKMMAKEGDETMDTARELFFERNGIKFDEVEASLMKESFAKGQPAGSKYVNLLGIIGASTGFTGAVGGAVLGAGMEHYGPTIARKLTSGKMASWLATEKIIGDMARKLDKIPKIIRNPGSGVARANIERLGVKLYRDVYMDMNERERKKAGMTSTKATADNIDTREVQLNFWKAMTHRDERYHSDPNVMMAEIENKTGLISGDENLSGAMVEHMIRANDYLADVIPKDPMPESPFIEDDEKWEPSDYDLDVFSQQSLAVNDPLVIVDALLDDTLTREMTDAVGATSPSILEHVQTKMVEVISEHPKSFDYTKRISGSYIMGMELDPTASAESYMYYQGDIIAEQQQQEQIRGSFAPDLKRDPADFQTKSSKLEGGLRG